MYSKENQKLFSNASKYSKENQKFFSNASKYSKENQKLFSNASKYSKENNTKNILDPLPHRPNLGSSNSAANKDIMSKILTNGDTIF